MLSRTFTRLMLIFVLALSVCILLFISIFYFTLRDVQIENRMSALRAQAYDIAYLASNTQGSSLEAVFNANAARNNALMLRKLRTVYEDYSAYCMVVDRNGQVTPYFLSLLDENEELKASFDAENIVNSLRQVLSGTEVTEQVSSQSGPMFTVAVPWISSNRVVGGVYIQTAAQSVQASYQPLAQRMALAALVTFLVTALLVFALTRRITKPLQEMAQTASSLSRGDFSHRVDEAGSREILELAVAFNSMASTLDKLEQSRRDFIANLSHELRSPMTNIHGFIQGMLDGAVPEEERRHYLQVVLSETDRLTKLINGLLSLSRLEDGSAKLATTHFNLNELIRLVLITKINQLEQKDIDVKLSFQQEEQFVEANRDQIEQVLINLIDNACKFTPERGNMEISTALKDQNTVEVVVRDDGIGVLPQDAPYLFDRFYKADKAHTAGEGTGLGLAICRMILERHGQQIRLLDVEDGAAFAFTLKAGSQKEAQA